MTGDGLTPAKVARRGPVFEPPAKCTAHIPVGDHWTWCPNVKHPDTPDGRPRCEDHKTDDTPEEGQR